MDPARKGATLAVTPQRPWRIETAGHAWTRCLDLDGAEIPPPVIVHSDSHRDTHATCSINVPLLASSLR
jgi:hypothetical protein